MFPVLFPVMTNGGNQWENAKWVEGWYILLLKDTEANFCTIPIFRPDSC